MNKKYFFLLFLFFVPFFLQAVPAYPYPTQLTQPDGTKITVLLKGDEFHHYYTTEDNYLLIKDEKGFFCYAQAEQNGEIKSLHIRAKEVKKRSKQEQKLLLQTKKVSSQFVASNKLKKRNRMVESGSIAPRPSKFPRIGSPKSLVILVNFSNLSFQANHSRTEFYNLLNEEGYSNNGATGSARDYFKDNSMGSFSPQLDVVGPFNLPNTYEFYGENNKDGEDKNAVQMIVDACRMAFEAGVNFSQYDTDNNGFVDNVFVFYAGYNEAEMGGDNTIWPHRWSVMPGVNYEGTVNSTLFNGKRIRDYACTSELKGRNGSIMAGIATFAHEFGHVLGLADMYPTNGAKHHTLSKWSIMDDGTYLNDGRTPPSYNSFERFQLGFITPIPLISARDITLQPLNTHNQAYLISSENTHNLNPENPLPAEFFLLENRQKTGWDQFLPGQGMLIYRIFYDSNDWYYNEPNNNPNKMGVDIMEADGIASESSLSGDPFPGTKKITYYNPTLRNGAELKGKEITQIVESKEIITFLYGDTEGKRPIYVVPPTATDATEISYDRFTANWEKVFDATGYYITVSYIDYLGNQIPHTTHQWTTDNHCTFYNLLSGKEYRYKVQASDRNEVLGYENITDFSNIMKLKTDENPEKSNLRVSVNSDGSVNVYAPDETIGNEEIFVYNVMGHLITNATAKNDITVIGKLPKNSILLIKLGDYSTKILIR